MTPRTTRLRIAAPLALLLGAATILHGDAAPQPLFAQNFDAAAEGNPPEGVLILNGDFAVKKVDGNGLLELAGNPIDSNGILVGPADKPTYAVSARIQAASTGRRFPEFGVGAAGPTGYRLWVMPAVGQLQLIKGEDVVKHVPFPWKSGDWTRFKLRVRQAGDGKLTIEGSAWPDGQPQPKDWMLTMDDAEPPQPGRACVFATTYSGQPARFDDVLVEPVP